MKDIIDAVCDLIEDLTELKPVVGAMPPNGGVAVQQSSGSVISAYLPRTGLNRTTVVINSKDKSQANALEMLTTVHRALTKMFGYESTEDWQIATIKVVNSPDFIGQENDESYMYGSAVEVLWYDRLMAENPQVENPHNGE